MAKKPKAEVFQPSGDVRRVQPLGPGWSTGTDARWVRIGDHAGKWHQLHALHDADVIWDLLQMIGAENPTVAAKVAGELVALDAELFDYAQAAVE